MKHCWILRSEVFAIRSQIGAVHCGGLDIIRCLEDVHLKSNKKCTHSSKVRSMLLWYRREIVASCILGNSNGGQQVVASNHHNTDASATSSYHGVRHTITFAQQNSLSRKASASLLHFYVECMRMSHLVIFWRGTQPSFPRPHG